MYRDKDGGSERESPEITVAVVTRDRAFSLKLTLERVRFLTGSSTDIIVVDNASSDDTPEVARTYGARYFYVAASKGIGHCRQVCLSEARGEFVIFLDDDCIPGDGWPTAMIDRFREGQGVVVIGGGVVNVGFQGAKVNKGLNRLGKNARAHQVSDPREADFFGNMNLGMRRKEVLALGGYDPFLNVMSDGDIQLRVKRAGYRVLYEPRAAVEHHNRGVFLKKRHLLFGLQVCRLYLFFKHYRPRAAGAWGTFFGNEARFLLKEAKKSGSLLVNSITGRSPKGITAAGREIFGATASRLLVPWLLYRAKKRNRWEDASAGKKGFRVGE